MEITPGFVYTDSDGFTNSTQTALNTHTLMEGAVLRNMGATAFHHLTAPIIVSTVTPTLTAAYWFNPDDFMMRRRVGAIDDWQANRWTPFGHGRWMTCFASSTVPKGAVVKALGSHLFDFSVGFDNYANVGVATNTCVSGDVIFVQMTSIANVLVTLWRGNPQDGTTTSYSHYSGGRFIVPGVQLAVGASGYAYPKNRNFSDNKSYFHRFGFALCTLDCLAGGALTVTALVVK